MVETSEKEAADRIQKREGHFYKGKMEQLPTTLPNANDESKPSQGDNSDWEFATVSFPHTILDGTHSIEHNAELVANGLLDICGTMRKQKDA